MQILSFPKVIPSVGYVVSQTENFSRDWTSSFERFTQFTDTHV